MQKFSRLALLSIAAPLALGLAGPATGQDRGRGFSQGESAQGAQANAQILQQFGGAFPGRQAAYVTQVGRRIAVQSGTDPQSAYTVTLLNSNVMNAFALPGGYVYVTRQLLATMNDEAELAFVLGHEVGHVAARHSQKRQGRSTLTSLGSLLLGAITKSSQIANLAGQAGQFIVLGYSRGQEYAADALGVQYLARAGYDPAAGADMLAALGGETALDARIKGRAENTKPSWASSHPLNADRVRRAQALAQQTRPAAPASRNRDAFLNAIDGMLIDDDPRQGLVDGRSFRHPDLRLGFEAPAGYAIVNGSDAVTVQGSGGQATFARGQGGDLDGEIDRVFRALGGGQTQINYSQPQRTTVNGLEAATAQAQANTQSGAVDVTVVAVRWPDNRIYNFTTITRAGSGVGPFGPMIGSLHRLSDREIAGIRPRRVQVVTVRPGDTVAKLAARMDYPDYRQERFLALNALSATAPLRPGYRVKIVTYGAAR